MAVKLRDLQVHLDGVDSVTGINHTGYWLFGIEDDTDSHVAYVKTPFGECLIDYSTTYYDPCNDFKPVYEADYNKLLTFCLTVNNLNCSAHLCTTKYPFDVLARKR